MSKTFKHDKFTDKAQQKKAQANKIKTERRIKDSLKYCTGGE